MRAKMRSFIVSVLVVVAASVATCCATEEQGQLLRSESQSCKGIELPYVRNLALCLSSSCDPAQDLIDAVGPLVKCVYEALKEYNSPADAVVAYRYVILELVNAVDNKHTQALSMDFVNTVNMVETTTIQLSYCFGDNISVSLPSALIGQCNSDFGTSCKRSKISLVAPLVSLVECLVGNALPNAPQDNIIALLCDLISSTDSAAFSRLPLWLGVHDIKTMWCM
ncbi:uncharacterized protein LOC142564923 [Dermacentor variabilis]|uniref:uncharacterized protein LOC142564923 n=1 Tax=Dermacentor variabilis TaxID=34621 RepID=UPI003F5AF3EA